MKWISVQDRLPEPNCVVLAYGEGEIGLAAIQKLQSAFAGGDTIWIDVCGAWGDLRQDITHWMPLPEPPKEKS